MHCHENLTLRTSSRHPDCSTHPKILEGQFCEKISCLPSDQEDAGEFDVAFHEKIESYVPENTILCVMNFNTESRLISHDCKFHGHFCEDLKYQCRTYCHQVFQYGR